MRWLPSWLAFALFTSFMAIARAEPGGVEYPAPLSQRTQPSYVPQSVALSGPPILAHAEGEPVPPGYTAVPRRRTGALIAGATVLGSLYMLSAMAASISADDDNELAPLFMPVVGPFAQLFGTESASGRFFLVVDGLGQSAGLALLIYGLTSMKTVLLRNDLTTSSSPRPRVLPVVSARGVGLVGTF
jgi:hypothetical protein